MAKKKRGGHGGHGWFVTFADLMSLLMSFFVMLTAFSSQDSKKLQAVAGSMRDAFGSQRNPRYAGIVEADGIPTRAKLKNVKIASPEEGSDFTVPSNLDKNEDGIFVTGFDRRFGEATASLRQALGEMPEIAELSKNIVVEETKEGLNISIVDQDGRSMFAEGAVTPFERTRRALQRIAPVLRRMPNRIQITGYTSSARPGSLPGWSGWELSAGRASAVREILAGAGVADNRFYAVAGKSDTDPAFPDNPYLAANRRVTILLMRETAPVPPQTRP
ncbi:flagellar motor protein MotB [Terrarubrum flagellatum]|uniref:OmpA/MotB family protein n=1 Tax=Terrirubrum flagellatum TaxID=2895980 RepID=UPI00314568C4